MPLCNLTLSLRPTIRLESWYGDSISVLEATCFAVILSAIFLYSNLAKDYKPAAALPSAT